VHLGAATVHEVEGIGSVGAVGEGEVAEDFLYFGGFSMVKVPVFYCIETVHRDLGRGQSKLLKGDKVALQSL